MEKLSRLDCIHCSDEFSHFNDYTNHLVGVHEMRIPDKQQDKKFGSKLWYRGFKYQSRLQDHQQKIHSPDLDKLMMQMQIENLQFECVKCEQKIIFQETFQYHNVYGHMNISKKKIAAARKVNQAKEYKLCYKRF